MSWASKASTAGSSPFAKSRASRISGRPRPYAENTYELETDDACLLLELAVERHAKGLAPFERPAREPPGPGVGTPDEQSATVARSRHGADAHDGTAQDVPRDLVDDAVCGLG